MALSLVVNGQSRQLPTLDDGSTLDVVVSELSLKADRVAIERNGEIAPRVRWTQTPIHSGDRLEIVHFVGGGSTSICPPLHLSSKGRASHRRAGIASRTIAGRAG